MKNFTSNEDIIVFEGGYHGNTNSTVEISNYKYMGLGGKGESKHVHSIPIPDSFRGKYNDVKNQISVKWNDPRINFKWPLKRAVRIFSGF